MLEFLQLCRAKQRAKGKNTTGPVRSPSNRPHNSRIRPWGGECPNNEQCSWIRTVQFPQTEHDALATREQMWPSVPARFRWPSGGSHLLPECCPSLPLRSSNSPAGSRRHQALSRMPRPAGGMVAVDTFQRGNCSVEMVSFLSEFGDYCVQSWQRLGKGLIFLAGQSDGCGEASDFDSAKHYTSFPPESVFCPAQRPWDDDWLHSCPKGLFSYSPL